MTRKNRLEALEIIEKQGGTVVLHPTVKGFVHDDMMCLTDCCHNTIKALIENEFSLHLQEGRLFITKF